MLYLEDKHHNPIYLLTNGDLFTYLLTDLFN